MKTKWKVQDQEASVNYSAKQQVSVDLSVTCTWVSNFTDYSDLCHLC